MNKISVVIPSFNEDADIQKLIDAIRHAPEVEEIILVDDHSEEKYAQMYRQIPGITLIRHDINQGKTPAVQTGIQASRAPFILVLDADLIGLTPKHLSHLAQLTNSYDLVCLVRGDDSRVGKIIGSTFITRGEHLFSREFYEHYKNELFDGTRWGFDNNINDILLRGAVTFTFAEMVGVAHKMKSKKYSFWKGLWLDLNMFHEVVIQKYKIIHWLGVYGRLFHKIRQRVRIG